MGVYDILPGGQQVKCWWSEMREIKFGQAVSPVGDQTAYSIILKEGGYANVTNCKLISITDKPIHRQIFDKWGFIWGGEDK